VHVVIMHLLQEVCRSGRTGVQVQSNEGEGTAALMSVDIDELALPKAHVCLIRERRGRTRAVRSSSPTSNVRQTHQPIEVTNLRWVADVCQWSRGIQRVMVDRDPEGFERYDTPRELA
jgi:hypothetical protein